MRELLPQLSRYKCYIKLPDNSRRVDITDYVTSVRLEIDLNKISMLTFTLIKPDIHLEYLKIGYGIDFYGGASNDEFFIDRLSEENFKYLFNGNVRIIYTRYQDDGRALLEVSSVDSVWGASANEPLHLAYPSDDCERPWAAVSSLKLSDIVKNLLDIELGITNYTINVGNDTDHTYTLLRPAYQNELTDWAFLRKLAADNGCYVWTYLTSQGMGVNFVDCSKAVSQKNDLEFVYVARKGVEFLQGDYYPTTPPLQGNSEFEKVKPNQLVLLEATIDENPQLIVDNMIITKVTDFDEHGEEHEVFTAYDETKDEIIYYKLDEDKVAAEDDETLNKLLQMGAFSIPREVFLKYYIKVKIVKGIVNAINKPFLGINVSASVKGNVHIEPSQSYAVHGISRYSSWNKKSWNFFLRSMSHEWGEDNSFITKLDFII